jgi:hypothetical protein
LAWQLARAVTRRGRRDKGNHIDDEVQEAKRERISQRNE